MDLQVSNAEMDIDDCDPLRSSKTDKSIGLIEEEEKEEDNPYASMALLE